MSLQARVEGHNFLKRATAEALVNSVFDVWQNDKLNSIMVKVFDKLKVVFCNILKGDGLNDLVEKN